MKSIGALFFIFSFVPHLWEHSTNTSMLKRTKVLMGTFVSITLPTKEKQYFKPAFQVLKDVENSLSSFKKNTPIYRLNKNKNANLDTYAYEALSLSKYYYEQTDGYFNIAIGSITKDLYKFGQKERVPTTQQLQKSST